ncbi:DUF4468 domain-containing protein [Phocaeicola barnesiae]|uniref:DUF4468 domain-containing protein n=1 Tax=Phocaeicola barnesiae TaxID=376804 RepID=UPI0025A425B8|nr:DUF4468 domain-containing protein [Phocaeicola barnesiae]MDM8233253.1 DUF4468 domain-containing protein [Phocaeicola barnesiae]
MNKFLLILLLCFPLALTANEKKDNTDPKYLKNAITMVDGKVTFKQTLEAPSLSKEQLYNLLLNWSDQYFKPNEKLPQHRVVYTNQDKGEIVAMGEEYIVFSSSALSLDRTRIYYQLYFEIQNGKCDLTMSRIRYWYDENRDGGQRYDAEEWITDEMALNKKKTKLAPICGKFRRGTIDLKDKLFEDAAQVIGTTRTAQTPATTLVPASTVAIESVPSTTPKELQIVTIEKLPANLSELAAAGRITVKVNDEEIDMKADNWGGFGKLLTKDVAYTLVDQSRIAVNAAMEHSDNYTISFYPKGQTQPIVVIECKKVTAQKMTAEELKTLNQSADSSKNYTLYIGEILRIQMR